MEFHCLSYARATSQQFENPANKFDLLFSITTAKQSKCTEETRKENFVSIIQDDPVASSLTHL
jgi:hypothetical protein